jgi:hypothetical protein
MNNIMVMYYKRQEMEMEAVVSYLSVMSRHSCGRFSLLRPGERYDCILKQARILPFNSLNPEIRPENLEFSSYLAEKTNNASPS